MFYVQGTVLNGTENNKEESEDRSLPYSDIHVEDSLGWV